METIATSKKELIDWITTIEDSETIMILKGIKHEKTFNFEEEWKKAIPFEVAKNRSLENVRKMFKK